MNAATLDTYMNLVLLVVIIGGAAFGIYRMSRPKTPPPRDVPQRPGGYKPRPVEDEERHERPPIENWRDMPTRSPMRQAIVEPPTFRHQAPKAPVTPSRAPKSYKTASKPKASTGGHSPYRSNDDATIPVIIASDSPRCDTPTHSGDSGGSSGGDSGGSCSPD